MTIAIFLKFSCFIAEKCLQPCSVSQSCGYHIQASQPASNTHTHTDASLSNRTADPKDDLYIGEWCQYIYTLLTCFVNVCVRIGTRYWRAPLAQNLLVCSGGRPCSAACKRNNTNVLIPTKCAPSLSQLRYICAGCISFENLMGITYCKIVC